MQSVPGVPKIKDGYNPATWMLEVSSAAVETQLDMNFAEIYSNSDLYRYVKRIRKCQSVSIEFFHHSISRNYIIMESISFYAFCRRNQELNAELSIPAPGSKDLYFPTKYSQPFLTQFTACFWKQHWSYWRNPQYNVIRFFMTIVIGIIFGVIFWNKGKKM